MVDSETGQAELRAMKAEIHRMEVSHTCMYMYMLSHTFEPEEVDSISSKHSKYL